MSEHVAIPPEADVRGQRPSGGLLARCAGIGRREVWGYGVWLGMGAVIAVPELWAAVGKNVPWPTISGTVGHLEYEWSPAAIFAVGLIVFAAFNALQHRRSQAPDAGPSLARTASGRLTKKTTSQIDEVSPILYFASALASVAVGSLIAALVTDDRWYLAYVLYGLIGIFWIVIPSIAAYAFGKEVPFPTLFQTLADLQTRLHLFAMLLLTGLTVLLLHLAFYPWPNISHILQHKPPTTHSP
jgi:hypothetical protein